ncbi:hypothetical protein MycrhDRAFT_1978 [Mycolicibacterium rhodesiae JS60]|nr:hypothetical protein MycrhDRAFT_1978 [Mycolicibacterium rhodesiae JS60]
MPDNPDTIDEAAATVVHNLGEAKDAADSTIEHLTDIYRYVDPDHRREIAEIVDGLQDLADRIEYLADDLGDNEESDR